MINATPFLKFYAKYRYAQLSRQNPVVTQEKQLFKLLKKAKDTKFGADHGFKTISSVAEFQKQVPLRYYEDFWQEYWSSPFPLVDNCTWPGRIEYFPVTSGTSTGSTKYIPYTKEMTASNTKAGLDLLVYHMQHNPQSKIFGGRNFMLGGTTELVQEAPGVFSGDLSGIAVKELPWWIKRRYFPPEKLALIKNWEEKIELLAKKSLSADIRLLSGVPSWLLIFFDKLKELNPKLDGKIVDFFPNLEILVHGGVNFAPYHKLFVDLLQGSRAELREVYPASEGFIAVADKGYAEGLRMVLDHGVFYEFVPLEELDAPNPTRHWIKTIEKDINYAIVMSTCAGAWSYVLGDTVKFVDLDPPRLLISGRTSYSLSAFGEHLIGEEIEDAVSYAADAISASVKDYSVGAIYPEKEGELGGHLFIVEFAGTIPPTEIQKTYSEQLDKKLCQRNEDYEAHRAKGYGLKEPTILAVKEGTFAAWMKKRGKLGGQNKVPRIITKQELFDDLKGFAIDFDKA